MTPEQCELWRKIESFDIDGGESKLPFVARLGREHGWKRRYADRVVLEYKRYVFLTMCSNRPRCPSEDVDAAWHLHLTFTRSYWERFCGGVLGQPLHHEPTRGGPTEAAKHIDMYGETLAAYRRAFGEEPPIDIWPPIQQRFGDDTRLQCVNTARNWIVPKQFVKRAVLLAAVVITAAVLLPGCNGEINPFALKGAEFLVFLIPAMIAAVCLGRFLRSRWRYPGPQPQDENESLTWEQTAFVAGGYPRLTTAAIARLAEDNIVIVDLSQLGPGPVIPKNRSAVEKVIIRHLPMRATELKSVQADVKATFADQAAQLEEDGYSISPSRQMLASAVSLTPLLLVVAALGLPRLSMGLSAGKPVAFLVMTLIIGGILGTILCLVGSIRQTRRGKHVLDQLRTRHVEHKSDAGMAVALFGTAILAGTSIAYMTNWFPRQRSIGADGGCGSGCSAGCGGGGGGCGGGGGGCGGCGGGGD